MAQGTVGIGQAGRHGKVETARFRLAAAAIFVASLIVVISGLAGSSSSGSLLEILAFAAAAALAGFLSVRSPSSSALSLDMPILLAAGLVFGPGVGGALALIAYVDPREWHREISVFRALCNRGQTALSVSAGAAVFAGVGGELGDWPISLAAGLLALATDISLNYVLVGLMTSLRTGESLQASLSRLQLGPRGLFAIMYFAYGLMSVLLAEATVAMGLRGFITFAVPLALAKGVFEQSRQVLQLRRASDEQAAALVSATDSLAQERQDERRVLAGELHDEVLPPLFKVHLMGQVLRQDLDAGRLLELDDDIPELLSATETAQLAIRDVVRGLRTAKVGPRGLESSIRLLAQRLESAGSPGFVIEADALVGSDSAQLLCYQVAREAMSNSAKHSRASSVQITLRNRDECLELCVADDGIGFDPQAVDTELHFGLSMIGERVKAFGGTVNVHTKLGGGTSVHALIPEGGQNKTPD